MVSQDQVSSGGIISYGTPESVCHVKCHTGYPCQYPSETDFRIIVLTFNRPSSLHKCLNHIKQLETSAERIVVDIWLDRNLSGEINHNSLDVALDFINSWKKVKKYVAL